MSFVFSSLEEASWLGLRRADIGRCTKGRVNFILNRFIVQFAGCMIFDTDFFRRTIAGICKELWPDGTTFRYRVLDINVPIISSLCRLFYTKQPKKTSNGVYFAVHYLFKRPSNVEATTVCTRALNDVLFNIVILNIYFLHPKKNFYILYAGPL